MPKTRKDAPDAEVKQGYVDERTAIVREYDDKAEGFKHMWLSVEADHARLSRAGIEVVKEANGELITNKMSMLCRQPKELFEAKLRAQEAVSRRRIEEIRNDGSNGMRFISDPITRFAEPKTPPKAAR